MWGGLGRPGAAQFSVAHKSARDSGRAERCDKDMWHRRNRPDAGMDRGSFVGRNEWCSRQTSAPEQVQ